jgi:4-amino-4-deoxy-L-arabinose transferase-like glycosyltransferase
VAVLTVAAVLRVAAIFTVGDVAEPHGDEAYYVAAAQSLAAGSGYPGSMRPPAFAFYLAAASRLLGDSLTQLRLAMLPLSLASVALVFALVSRRFGPGPALVSGLFAALNPDLVHYTHFLWSETLLAALLLAALWALHRYAADGRRTWLAAAGLALGGAALTREMALGLVPLVAWWLLRGPRERGLRSAAIVCAVAAACVVPWTVRNHRLLGRLVAVSTNRWYPVAEGNLLLDADPERAARRVRELRRSYYGNPDEFSREAAARGQALAAIRDQQPLWLLKKSAFNTCLLLAPSRSQLARFLEEGWLRPRWRPAAAVLVRLEAVVYALGVLVGIIGLWLVPGDRLKWLVAALCLAFLAVYIVANAAHRFRVPLLPLLCLYAGPLLCGRVVLSPGRMAGALLGALVFLAVVAADLAGFPVVLVPQY